MQRFDLIIRNGKAILPALGEQAVDIAISKEKIAALLAPGAGVGAASTLDATDLTIMPGETVAGVPARLLRPAEAQLVSYPTG